MFLGGASSRKYSKSEIAEYDLNDAEMCIAWNEPLAERGYHFKNKGLQKYFESTPWYEDRGYTGNLDGVAAKNSELIRSMAGNSPWKNLATH